MFQLTITTAGLDALVDAQNGATDPIQITEVGLTAANFVVAPTLVALPGEFKRLSALSGVAASETVIHMTAQDSSADIYALRGFALYLADGTLFAVYGQEDLIVSKVSIAAFLISLDVAFADAVSGDIEFGDTTFLFPPATELMKGAIEIATQGEVDAGTDPARAVTPLTLAGRLAAVLTSIANRALNTITITGGGLATGGGNLTGNRVITVTAATQAEAAAGVLGDRAVTPSSLGPLIADIANRPLKTLTITGGGLANGGGDLTGSRVITVPAASQAEAAAGVIGDKAVTPSSLGPLIADIGNRAVKTLTVTGGGLAIGGGDLTGSRVITVPAASQAEAAAGIIGDKAVTPSSLGPLIVDINNRISGEGTIKIIKTGSISVSIPSGASVAFPVAFPSACLGVLLTPMGNMNEGDERDEPWWVASYNAAGFIIGTNDNGNTVTFQWLALGY